MASILLSVFLFCGLLVVAVGLIVFRFIQLTHHFQEILANGVETDALVVRKYGKYRLAYEYRDVTGKIHRMDKRVFYSEYDRTQVGQTLKIIYSAKRPHIHTTKEAVEQSRAAQAREAEKQQSAMRRE
ncbi:MAG: DUF3592 domain-containing protein [Chloracidobacterium sp.]|uniref:DUF3592 domain-containing protein n=1 Tax=Chloracidobacterium validum TaxID=2821543 RepID=A0ABX8B6Z6_9BACT|nr:DUF3592 domain-containing protein [Chloracidobacterium validum]QUW02207.1 DUF3592 domain-containing protein [Chloracidobacterium validum]